MKLLKKLTTWDYLLIAVAVIALVLLVTAGGCAVGTSLGDNTPMVGLRLGEGDGDALKQGAATVGGLIGSAFGPGGSVVGAGIGTAIGGIGAALLGWRNKRKQDEAFDEGVARGAGVPVATALPVAPKPVAT